MSQSQTLTDLELLKQKTVTCVRVTPGQTRDQDALLQPVSRGHGHEVIIEVFDETPSLFFRTKFHTSQQSKL